jgi:hypothetical protein
MKKSGKFGSLGSLGSLGPGPMSKLPLPEGAAAHGALAYVGELAHHAVPKPPRIGRMDRPRGGKGPKNPEA